MLAPYVRLVSQAGMVLRATPSTPTTPASRAARNHLANWEPAAETAMDDRVALSLVLDDVAPCRRGGTGPVRPARTMRISGQA